MALTYARVEDFTKLKKIETAESSAADEYEIIRRYLREATRLIDRYTLRHFFPICEQREYPVPAEFVNLRFRVFPSADLNLDDDLLSITTLETGVTGNLTELTEDTHFQKRPWNDYPKYGLRLMFPTFWNGVLTSLNNWRIPSIFVTGVWGYHERYETDAWIDTNVNLQAELNATDTTFNIPAVADPAVVDDVGDTDIQAGELLKIEDEYLEVVSVSDADPRVVTVRRSRNGTTAAVHASATDIYKWNVHEDIQELCLDIAKTWREKGTTFGGRAGVSDMSVGAKLAISDDTLTMLVNYQRETVLEGWQ